MIIIPLVSIGNRRGCLQKKKIIIHFLLIFFSLRPSVCVNGNFYSELGDGRHTFAVCGQPRREKMFEQFFFKFSSHFKIKYIAIFIFRVLAKHNRVIISTNPIKIDAIKYIFFFHLICIMSWFPCGNEGNEDPKQTHQDEDVYFQIVYTRY